LVPRIDHNARAINFLRHPDEASNASGRNWLLASGQRRMSAAGSGFMLLHQ
jgi:hypothetical protein